jgi:hypothetical protein
MSYISKPYKLTNLSKKTSIQLIEEFKAIPASVTRLDLGHNYLGSNNSELDEILKAIPRGITVLNLEQNDLYKKMELN